MPDQQPTQEQIREFWEWCNALCPNCGKRIATDDKVKSYYKPDICYCHTVQLDIDPNNLFKHAVPKMWIFKIELIEGIFWVVTASCPDVHGVGKHGNGKSLNERLVLAIFWAIWSVIHNKE